MHRITQQRHVRAARPWLWTALVVGSVVAATVWAVRPHAAECRSVVTVQPPIRHSAPAVTVPYSAAPEAPSIVEWHDAPVAAEARYYVFTPGVACSFPDLPMDGYYIGAPTVEYDGSAACGAYVDLTGPLGTVRAQIVDRCPGCGADQYDLSTAAFTRIADPTAGVAQIVMSRVHNPAPPADLVYRVAAGSSSDWLGLLFTDSGNPLSRVEIRNSSGGPGYTLTRGMDDYWSISGAGPGPFTALVTDVDGHQVEVHGITPAPGSGQHTGRSLYALAPPTTTAPVPMAAGATVAPAPVRCM
ncbi:expansin EXLX1 family cellulose-binding protein [Nocardia alni]|uniref:expansin EXLX1 family cellulose-binding protein n=1 Tax=Nocardia alni TaxID=2815723 RepID=UPI001C22CDA7|nr:expansin EXLX1 family cellulose-binding protein [Nocardia alni]